MSYKNIELEGSDNKSHKLSEIDGKVVLYFYPKDNTPGCTIQAIDFTKYAKDFAAEGYTVIGVSNDSIKSHHDFIEDQDLNILLLSDKDRELSKAFDVVKETNMFGKKGIGTQRSTFILDENKDIVKEYRNVKANDHALKVLEDIKKL